VEGVLDSSVGSGDFESSNLVPPPAVTQAAKEQLRSYIERIERLEEEKAALAGDIRELFAQAKSTGFDTKAMRAVIRLRKQDANERRDQEAVLATYMHALGMLEGEL
jgi:uncharacterized protein (UPF0335 family)